MNEVYVLVTNVDDEDIYWNSDIPIIVFDNLESSLHESFRIIKDCIEFYLDEESGHQIFNEDIFEELLKNSRICCNDYWIHDSIKFEICCDYYESECEIEFNLSKNDEYLRSILIRKLPVHIKEE